MGVKASTRDRTRRFRSVCKKGLTIFAGAALKTIWQGAVRPSPTAIYQRCGVPATKRHVLWDCSWWQLHGEPVPHWWPWKDPAYSPCLWDFGLLPKDPSWLGVSPILDEALILTGVLLTGGFTLNTWRTTSAHRVGHRFAQERAECQPRRGQGHVASPSRHGC